MVKEAFIAALQRAGYDTISACEYAANMVKELQASPPGLYHIVAGRDTITVQRKG